ncbi:hypothetical protein [uncultured Tenacibaculum sp.]|uniref:hypothetical protein n=1 Tax=uncultured Tenacibaculum sp. TaxID=174713 RepID=UPI002629E2F2|nr:hypothetical protein [uncultured Tenacibaculum sp.]
MSDFILKFWPEENIQTDKTEKIKNQFKEKLIIGEESDFFGKPAFKGGDKLSEYFEPKWESAPKYFSTLFLTISKSDYGVEQGTEDFEYIERKNVISLLGADGTVESWTEMCSKLEKITGDKYKGNWELL